MCPQETTVNVRFSACYSEYMFRVVLRLMVY
jgi:hypothetical protein